MSQAPDYLLLGEILRPHGIRGELRVRMLTDYPERINDLEQIFLGKSVESTPTPYEVEHLRMHQGFGLLKLVGVDDRNAAEGFRELFVMVDIAHAIPLADDEIYLYQLIGLQVQTDDGRDLGILTEVLETGANDVYIVKGDLYGEVLIPVLQDTILKTDIDARMLLVKLPEGLLPE